MPIKGYYERSKHAGEAEWEGNTADGRVNGPAKTMRKVLKADAILFSPAVRALILGAFRTHLGLHHSAPIPGLCKSIATQRASSKPGRQANTLHLHPIYMEVHKAMGLP